MKSALMVGGRIIGLLFKKVKTYTSKLYINPSLVFEKHIKEVDCVILFINECSHDNMWRVRKLSKRHKKPIVYPRGTGTTGFLNKAIQTLDPRQGNF